MRILALLFLWLGVAGFGLATLCSGIFLPMMAQVALPVGLVSGALTWLCWRGVRSLRRRVPPTAAAAPGSPDGAAPAPPPVDE